MAEKTASPSRTYVAICDKMGFNDGYYMKKFTLPENVENSVSYASWYFLNRLNFTACIEFCMSFEDYSNIAEQKNPCLAVDDYIITW